MAEVSVITDILSSRQVRLRGHTRARDWPRTRGLALYRSSAPQEARIVRESADYGDESTAR